MRKKYLTEIIGRLKRADIIWLMRQAKKSAAIPFEAFTKRCVKGPLLASLAVTYRCNQACSYCELPERGRAKDELSTEEIKKVIDQLADLDVSSISFTGGEPLLRKDVPELIRHIKKYGISTNLTTNGMLVTTKLAETLAEAGLDSLGVSLDSADRDYVNSARGTPKAFDAAVNAIKAMAETKKRLRSDKPNVTVSAVLTSGNSDNIEGLVSLVKGLGANAISFGGVQVNFNVSEKTDLKKHIEDRDRLVSAVRKIREMRKKDPFIDNSASYLAHLERYVANEYPDIRCYAGYHSILIDCYGGVFPCFQFYENNRPVARLDEINSLKELWYGKKYDGIRKELLSCKDCFFVCQMEPNELYNFGRGKR